MEENTNANVTETTETSEKEGAVQETFTKEEVEKMLQSESDKRVTEAIKKVTAKYEKKLSLSQLDGEAREKAEKDNYIAELEDQLKEFKVLQTKNEVNKILGARNLNINFADVLKIGDDPDEAIKVIETFDKLVKEMVSDEVKRRLAGTIPKDSGIKVEGLTKDEFRKMTLAQQTQIYKENPELYKKLTK